jgi:hypothetical protein
MSARVSIVRSGFIAIAAGLVLAAAGTASAAPPGGGGHGGVARGGFVGGGYRGGWGGRGYYGGYRGYYGGYYGWRGGWGWGGWGCCGWGWAGLGWYLPVLPLGYATYYWGGVPYYYVNNGYFVWNGAAGQYEAVQPPAGFTPGAPAPAGAPPSGAQNYATGNGQWTDLFAYPKGGQSMEQQTRDRQECQQWASNETGFNPTQPPTDPRDAAAKRENYLRAETACLQGRNYSVK